VTVVRRSGHHYEIRVDGQLAGVAKYLDRHDEFADITDPATPEILTWLDTVLA
jgi:uncharacterized protein